VIVVGTFRSEEITIASNGFTPRQTRLLPRAANFKGRQIFEERKDKFLIVNLTFLHFH